MAKRSLRDLKIAAMEGDVVAMRKLLRHSRSPELADEVKRGKPIPPRVRKMLDALTAGTGTATELSEWEIRNERGEIENLLDPWDGQPWHLRAD